MKANGHGDEETADGLSGDEDEEISAINIKSKRKSKKTKKPKKSKKEKVKSTFQVLTKLGFMGSSILLIAVAALRFTVIEVQSVHDAIMNFYFLLFGVIIALCQLGIKTVKRNFRFMNYYWGKASFCLLIAGASLSNSQN